MDTRPLLLHLSPLSIVGGCEVNCLRVVRALPEYRHRIVVFDTPGAIVKSWAEAGAEVEHLDILNLASWRFSRALRRWWRQAGLTPAGIMYWSTVRLPLLLLAVDFRGKWTVHLGNPLRGISPARLWWCEALFRRREQVTLVACSQHVAASHRSVRYFRQFEQHVIYNPVLSGRSSIRRPRDLSLESDIVLGMTARLDPIKDHATLLRAVPRWMARYPQLRVELAGAGALEGELRRLAIELGIDRQVTFLGSVADVWSTMERWDLFVYSTTLQEGLGTALAEAMMAGLPCVVSDLPMMREIGEVDGVRYFPAGDAAAFAEAVLQLIPDRAARTLLATRGHALAAKKFDCHEVARQYLSLVQEAKVGLSP